MVALFKIPFC